MKRTVSFSPVIMFTIEDGKVTDCRIDWYSPYEDDEAQSPYDVEATEVARQFLETRLFDASQNVDLLSDLLAP